MDSLLTGCRSGLLVSGAVPVSFAALDSADEWLLETDGGAESPQHSGDSIDPSDQRHSGRLSRLSGCSPSFSVIRYLWPYLLVETITFTVRPPRLT